MVEIAEKTSDKGSFKNRCLCFFDKHAYLFLSAFLILGLTVRILALLSFKNSLYADHLIYDESVYHALAQKIADGTHRTASVHDFAPLPAYMMALVYKLFSPNTLYIRILNIIFGVFTCYFVYLIGRELYDPDGRPSASQAVNGTPGSTHPACTAKVIGLFACLVAVLYKPFIFFSITLLKTSLSLFLFAASVYLFVAVLNERSAIKLFFLGVCMGLLVNVRSNCVVLVPLILVILLLNIYRKTTAKVFWTALTVYLAGLILSVAPFTLIKYRLSGELTLTPQGGFNLYLANNLQNPYPYYRPVPFATSRPSEQAVQFIIEASRRTGHKLSPGEASSYWTREVVKTALNQPGAFVKKLFYKSLALFNQFEAADNYHIGFMSNHVRFFKLPFISLWLILPFGMAGMILDITRSKKSLALFLIFFLYASTLVAFFTNIRIRLPLLIILIPFAVIGINRLSSRIRNSKFKWIAIYFAIVVFFFSLEFLPVPGTDDMTSYYNTHAGVLAGKGYKDQATKYREMSSRMNRPYSAFANLTLAGSYADSGDISRAFYYLNKIPDDSLAAAAKYEKIGDLMLQQGKKEAAAAGYETSLSINSGERGVRMKLFRIYWETDKAKASREYDIYQYISSFYGDL